MGGPDRAHSRPTVDVLHTVRCLACRAVYSKPARGGTVTSNPGCPECGYVGCCGTASTRIAGGVVRRDEADAAEEVMLRRPDAHREAFPFERGDGRLGEAGLELNATA